LTNFVAVPEEKNVFEWHFLVYGLKDCPYENGFYHGRLSFPRDYPFKPPGIVMLTPNGRFEPGKKICTNFSDYHPELWNPSWTVSTIVIGLISFMIENEDTAGSIRTSEQQKRVFAANSLNYNFTSIQKFEQVFMPYFEKIGIDP
jgi:ubiquitin-conjugating enzyme E2 J2